MSEYREHLDNTALIISLISTLVSEQDSELVKELAVLLNKCFAQILLYMNPAHKAQ